MITLTAKIYINETEIIDVDRRNILNISCSIFDRSDLKFPSFGIISNVGEIEFNDIDGKILNFVEAGTLTNGAEVKIFLNNTLAEEASSEIGHFKTDNWRYDTDNKVVNVNIKDELEEWQNINVDGISYDPREVKHKNLEWVYNYLYEKTPAKYNMQTFDSLDESTKNVLSNTWIVYPMLKQGNLWRQWDKLCQVAQSHIKKEPDGTTSFKYNGGN
jgi:hypothetical protein